MSARNFFISLYGQFGNAPMYHYGRKYLLEVESRRLEFGQYRSEVVERKQHCPFG